MPTSAIYILNSNGKILISRNYRSDVSLTMIYKFMPLLLEKEEEGLVTPVLLAKECTFAFVKTNSLYFVSIMKKNSNVVMVMVYLHKILRIFIDYFDVLEEESIRDNFVMIYELLDEIMDFGYPQTTDCKILQQYIIQKGQKFEFLPRMITALTNAVSWRNEGIEYRNNEVFVDVIESVNLFANSNGHVIQNEIFGVIKIRVYLSGMPELRLGVNDKALFDPIDGNKSNCVELEDVKFHQCVRLSHFNDDRTISFIPPDGNFELMSYRLNSHDKPLIWIKCEIQRYDRSRVDYIITAKSNFKRRLTAKNVEIKIPVPDDVDSPEFDITIGKATYEPDRSAFIWSIKSFQGSKEYCMFAHFFLPSVENEEIDSKPPIEVKFEIPHYTVTGIQIRYLKIIEKNSYDAVLWIRYMTQNGNYQLRAN